MGNAAAKEGTVVIAHLPVAVCLPPTQVLTLLVVSKHALELFDPVTAARKTLVPLKGPPTHCAAFVEHEDLLITGDDQGRMRLYQVCAGL